MSVELLPDEPTLPPDTRVRWTLRPPGTHGLFTVFGRVTGTEDGLLQVRQEDSTNLHLLDPAMVTVLGPVT